VGYLEWQFTGVGVKNESMKSGPKIENSQLIDKFFYAFTGKDKLI
jgi:hypothetical protein